MVLAAIKKRKSVRDYLDKKIPEDILAEVLEAARLSPSASNRQNWKFVVIQNQELKQQLMQASRNQRFVGQAPVVIAGCATHTTHIMPNGVPSYPVDLAIALEHISLQAAELGLGTCWVGAFDQQKVKEILGIPKDVIVVCLMSLGYPGSNISHSDRKETKEIICYNYYS